MSEKALPRRQDALLRLIARHQRDGMVPSAAVLAQEMGLAGESSVTPALRALQSKDLLHVEGGIRGRQRFIRVTPKGARYLLEGLPVLGKIPAGAIGRATQASSRVVASLDELLEWEAGDFLVEVEGDSMVGAGICPGDLVLLRPGQDPHPGEIAAVQISSTCRGALKRVFVDAQAGIVCLKAAHPEHPDQRMPLSEIRIAGVMRGLIRRHRSEEPARQPG